MSELQYVFGNPRRKTARKPPAKKETYRRNPFTWGSDEHESSSKSGKASAGTPSKWAVPSGERGVISHYSPDSGREAREAQLEALAKKKEAEQKKLRSLQAEKFRRGSTLGAKASAPKRYGSRVEAAMRGTGEFADPVSFRNFESADAASAWLHGDDWSKDRAKGARASAVSKQSAKTNVDQGWETRRQIAEERKRKPTPTHTSVPAHTASRSEKGLMAFTPSGPQTSLGRDAEGRTRAEFNNDAKKAGGFWSIRHKAFVMPDHPDYASVAGSITAAGKARNKSTQARRGRVAPEFFPGEPTEERREGRTLSALAPVQTPDSQGGTMATKKKATRKSAKKSTRKSAKKSTRKSAKKSTRKTAKKSTRKTARKTATKAVRKTAKKKPARKTAAAAPEKAPRRKAKKSRSKSRAGFKPFAGSAKNAIEISKGQVVKMNGKLYKRNPIGSSMLPVGANVVERTLGMSMMEMGALLAAGGSYSAINGILSRLPILNKVKATLDNTPGVKIVSSSILPMVAGVLLKKYLGRNRMADAFGSALILTSISGIGVSALSPLINKTAGGLSGVDYTPYAGIPQGLEGVDYTPYNGIPDGLEGADFGNDYELGAADFGESGEGYEMGEEYEMGDDDEMGGVDYTPYGGIPDGLEGLDGDYAQAQMG